MKTKIIAASFILFFFALLNLNSQDAIKIKRLGIPVEFDGKPFDAAWEGLEFFPLTMNRPNYKSEPTEYSEVMVAYDDAYLWVGTRLFTKDVSKIFSPTKKRDEQLFNYDAFSIMLDTYNDNENAFIFFTNPSGLRTDFAISNDAAGGGFGGGGGMNFSWNTFWDVKTSKDDKGWYVEMRIPFSSLRFSPKDDITTMGMTITRIIAANNEADTYPAVDPRYGFSSIAKPSLAATIEIEGAKPMKPVYVAPYVIGGFSRDRIYNQDTTGYANDDNPSYNAGLDVKYSFNSNLTLDLTFNTDFAQVEADNQQVNLTRYSLYFPEKRMFFQERSGLFSYSLGGFRDNLFYSRRIGMTYDGSPIKIYGGARLAGRIGKWDVGLLDMQTEDHGFTPTENFGVFRIRRQVINPNSFAGGMFTSRIGKGGSQNYAYGLDGIFRVFGDDYFSVKMARTYDSESDTNSMEFIKPTFMMANWERRSEKGFAYNFTYSYSGERFNPGIGFVQRPAIQGFSGSLTYGWMPGPESKLFSYSVSLESERFTRLEDGKLESFSIGPQFQISAKNDLMVMFSFNYQEEGITRNIYLPGGIFVNPGNYKLLGLRASINSPETKKISVRTDFEAGEFYDGLKYSFSVGPTFKFSSSLQFSGSYGFDAIRFPDRVDNTKLNIHNINARVLYMLNTKVSATLLVQYVNTDDEFITNFRLRYNPREGNDFYLVFNEYRSIDNKNEVPSSPSYFNRTVMLKYTHTFRL
jgi:hypothetical protein